MEEQDLQEMVMSRQKNSPLQYLIASTMQDRVRATVAQSQVIHHFAVFPVFSISNFYCKPFNLCIF